MNKARTIAFLLIQSSLLSTSFVMANTELSGVVYPESYQSIKGGYYDVYGKDSEYVYYEKQIIERADYLSFVPLKTTFKSKKVPTRWIHGAPMARDRNYVYVAGYRVNSADPNTFYILADLYARDRKYVFYDLEPIQDSHPQSFKLEKNENKPSFYADKNYVYSNGEIQYHIDRSTFQTIKDIYSTSDNYSKDQSHVFYKFKTIEGADPESFKFEDNQYKFSFYADKNHVYLDGQIQQQIDRSTFTVINRNYSKDQSHVFYDLQPIEGADPASFELMQSNYSNYENYAKDKNHAYYNGRIIEGADLATFTINQWVINDKNYLYKEGKADFAIQGPFIILEHDYVKDQKNVYLIKDKNANNLSYQELFEIIPNADPHSFDLVRNVSPNGKKIDASRFAVDNNHAYYEGKIIPNASSKSLKYLGYWRFYL